MLRSKRHLRTQNNSVSLYRRLTGRWRVLPNLVVVGSERSGSTSMYQYLVDHPLISPSLWKEVHYFDKARNYTKGQYWYRGHFALRRHLDRLSRRHGHAAYAVEATPTYIVQERTIVRLAALIPDAKLVILMRNPATRAYSHYQNARRKGREPDSFDDAVDKELQWYRSQPKDGAREYDDEKGPSRVYLRRGIYITRLRCLRKHFAPEQMTIIRSEDLFQDTQQVYDRLLAFLDLPPHQLRDLKPRNTLAYSEHINPETRARMIEFFAPYNLQLYDCLGRDFQWE